MYITAFEFAFWPADLTVSSRLRAMGQTMLHRSLLAVVS